MLGVTPQGNGPLVLAPTPLGKGGEGAVYSVVSHNIPGVKPADTLVAKTYFDPNEHNRRDKLRAMISSPVTAGGVAWPTALVFSETKQFLGYLMPKLDSKSNREWLYLANVKDRRRVAPDFDTRYAFVAVRNLAAAILAVHAAGHRVGDINESNISINATGTVFIVDTDSMQIAAADGAIYPCNVGKPEYTAPELTHGSLKDTPRTEETDIFAFAVAAYQLLTGGATPHQGVFDPENPNDPMSNVDRIRKGVLPNLDPNLALTYGFTPKPGVPVHALPKFLKEHLISFLSVNPNHRNTPATNLSTLVRELDEYVSTLQQCPRQRLHWYAAGEPCGWCAEAADSGVDPWGSQTVINPPKQMGLPAIGFGDNANNSAPQRAQAAVAGAAAQQAHQLASGLPVPQTPPSTQQTQQPQRPAKIKGKITVEYADGSWGVRPPLGRMFKQSPRMAIWAMKEETPDILRFWWPVQRNLANPLGIILGLVSSFLFGGAWIATGYFAATKFAEPNLSQLLEYVGLASFVTVFLAAVFLSVSAARDRLKTARKYGKLQGFQVEPMWRTLIRYVPLGFFYGAPIIVILAGLLVFATLSLVRAIGRA